MKEIKSTDVLSLYVELQDGETATHRINASDLPRFYSTGGTVIQAWDIDTEVCQCYPVHTIKKFNMVVEDAE